MFEKIRKLLKSQTASDIRQALAELGVAEFANALAAARARRTDLLLTGTDEQVLEAEKAVEVARLSFERADAARTELEAKLAAAEAAEWDAAFQKKWNAADADAAATFEFIREKVVPAVQIIEEALQRKAASDAKIREIVQTITVHSFQDNAAGRAGLPQDVKSRINSSAILPSWLSARFERH
ncbi:hypothetical protein LJR030_001509 [Rhizobium sp. LjRoot30]|uniref:hypothetical protein n=1 Tax=Rhizobium sp. LjRoot30 TaxID=3342320 RepID=UPI003ECE7B05